MCGRYTLAGPDPSVLRARFPLGESVEIERRYNVAPGDDVVGVIRRRDHEPQGTLLRWGLVPHWSKDPKVGYRTINARAESLAERPAFRRAFERHRCLIIADGFYEWQKLDDSPHAIHDRMPVILPADAETAWLDPASDPEELRELLRPLPDDRTAVRAVGDAVNDAHYDGPACLDPPSGDRPRGVAARLF